MYDAYQKKINAKNVIYLKHIKKYMEIRKYDTRRKKPFTERPLHEIGVWHGKMSSKGSIVQ